MADCPECLGAGHLMSDKWVDPVRIYLQPLCCVSPFEGRQWCEDNVWPVDGECEEAGVEYVRADLIQSLQAKLDEKDVVIGRLREALDEIAYASWPSVNGDDPVKRIQALAQSALTPENSR